jgi:SAM-dependent methyltransferase
MAVEAGDLPRGTLLEIGSGTGTNARWLARQGYVVTGVDLSPTAVKRATESGADDGDVPRFEVLDFMARDVPGAPFCAAWDRGCFHTQRTDEDRARFANRLADQLQPEGLWLSVIGSTDGPPRDTGPPRVSALEVARAVEPRFEILELRTSLMDTSTETAPRIWVLLARKRA